MNRTFSFKTLLPHLAAVLFFFGLTATYFSPVLFEKKGLAQNDILQHRGSSQEAKELPGKNRRRSSLDQFHVQRHANLPDQHPLFRRPDAVCPPGHYPEFTGHGCQHFPDAGLCLYFICGHGHEYLAGHCGGHCICVYFLQFHYSGSGPQHQIAFYCLHSVGFGRSYFNVPERYAAISGWAQRCLLSALPCTSGQITCRSLIIYCCLS